MASKKKEVAKKEVVKKPVAVRVPKVVEAKYSALIRIPTVMYGYVEISMVGTQEEIMKTHHQFVSMGQHNVAKAEPVARMEDASAKEVNAKLSIAAEEDKESEPVKTNAAGASRVDEMFKKKGEEVRSTGVVMRSKSWIIAEERLSAITNPNALEVLAGQVRNSEKMPEAEKPEFLKLVAAKEQELTEALLD